MVTHDTVRVCGEPRLRPIDTHLAYFVLCRTLIQEKIVSYIEAVLNKTKQISKIRH